MTIDDTWTCDACGELHDELPMSYAVPAPDAWPDDEDETAGNALSEDQCVIGGEHYFIRGLIEIPVIGGGPDDVFSWNVWCSLSEKSFDRAQELWELPGRENEPPYFSWVSNDVGMYDESTLNLKAMVHTREVGRRPYVELEPTDHPLAVEQRTGITLDRIRAIAQMVMHGGDDRRPGPAFAASPQKNRLFVHLIRQCHKIG